jgi:hypothetical protein
MSYKLRGYELRAMSYVPGSRLGHADDNFHAGNPAEYRTIDGDGKPHRIGERARDSWNGFGEAESLDVDPSLNLEPSLDPQLRSYLIMDQKCKLFGLLRGRKPQHLCGS